MSRTFGIWIEGMPDGMIEPHWLPNDERTGDWTGSEEEAKRRAYCVGLIVERPEAFEAPIDIQKLHGAAVRAAIECVALRRLSGTCLLCGRVEDRLKPDPCPDACPGRALRNAVEAIPSGSV